MSNPFDFINSISTSEANQVLDGTLDASDYNPFMVNRGLSLYMDTVLLANEMNLRGGIPNEAQYHFLHTLVTKRKRYSKWPKKMSGKNDQKFVQTLVKNYRFSMDKALEMVSLLTEDQKKQVVQEFEIPETRKRRS